MRRLRTLAAALACLALVAAFRAPAAGQGDEVVVAVNTHDGASVLRLAFSVRRVMDETVHQSDAAVESCEACETAAIAFQVVLVMTDPDTVTPTDLALALNESCTLCETLASAVQMVLGTGGPVRFTDEGNRRLAELRLRLQQLRTADLTLEQLAAELEAVTEELRDIVATELVPAGNRAATPPAAEVTTPAASGSSPSSSTTTSGSPTSSTTTSPSSSTTTSGSPTSSTTTSAPFSTSSTSAMGNSSPSSTSSSTSEPPPTTSTTRSSTTASPS